VVTPDDELPIHQVAVVVFAEVRAVDQIDAEHVVEGLLHEHFRPGTVHETSKGAMTWRTKIHTMRGLGTAWSYLGLVATSQAFRGERGEAL
jgi:hypothetical protein